MTERGKGKGGERAEKERRKGVERVEKGREKAEKGLYQKQLLQGRRVMKGTSERPSLSDERVILP